MAGKVSSGGRWGEVSTFVDGNDIERAGGCETGQKRKTLLRKAHRITWSDNTRSSSATVMLHLLPAEIIIQVFSHLPYRDLLACSLVSATRHLV